MTDNWGEIFRLSARYSGRLSLIIYLICFYHFTFSFIKKNSSEKLNNVNAVKADAQKYIQQEVNSIFLMRCYLPKNDLIKKLEKHISNNKSNTFIVSSNSNTEGLSEEAFHVKREKFLINNDEYRFIDVITVK